LRSIAVILEEHLDFGTGTVSIPRIERLGAVIGELHHRVDLDVPILRLHPVLRLVPRGGEGQLDVRLAVTQTSLLRGAYPSTRTPRRSLVSAAVGDSLYCRERSLETEAQVDDPLKRFLERRPVQCPIHVSTLQSF